ncbi:MAG: putative protease [Oleiphilaceae bacterium]|jgi:putative protease
MGLEIDVKNKFLLGDKLELVLPEGNIEFTLETLINNTAEAITFAPSSGRNVRLLYTEPVRKQGLVARSL